MGDPANYENAEGLEMSWATEAMGFADRHWELLTGLTEVKKMKVTSADAELYAAFRAAFPDLAVNVIDEEQMKSKEGKANWRAFLDGFVKRYVEEDYNFGTLLRVDSSGKYDEANTTLVPRGQFYVIEIARNLEGFNVEL
uniref:Polysaccharide biosynthesis domain-containing protein n=1 Tax=Rhodosorus marinus TaxID=101924 RepID=A0A6T6L3H5_9RHOD|mmetsp:Transcript_17358/g.24884  ORF Transcript_17358/g.24884 Transcript_17358/m.24884 type:complete len:140 (+) Transcript_17358:66-485(+)